MDTPGDYNFAISDIHPNLALCPKQYSFTIQPTLCKASKLLDVFSSCAPTNIWDFEAKVYSIFTNFIHDKCFMSSFNEEKKRGSNLINNHLLVRHKRWSIPISAFILTLIAVAVSSFKRRGGMGVNLAFGITLGFLFIFFDKIFFLDFIKLATSFFCSIVSFSKA